MVGREPILLTYNPVCIGSDRIRMAVDSQAENIRHSVSIHLNCNRSARAERYNSVHTDRLAQPIDHNCRYHDDHNNCLIDVELVALHCDNYCYSLAAAPAHDSVDRAMVVLACVVDIFERDVVALDRSGHASVRADQLEVLVSSALRIKSIIKYFVFSLFVFFSLHVSYSFRYFNSTTICTLQHNE